MHDTKYEDGKLKLDYLLHLPRTDRGFAFVYKGLIKKTTHWLEWNHENARWAAEYYAKRIWWKDMKTNQVRTIVRREMSE